MPYNNAKRILTGNEKIAQSAEGIYDQNLVILFWENIEAKHINECIDYLNHADQSIISGPSRFVDVDFEDDLYHLHAYYNESNQRIYRLMMRNPIQASVFEQETTKWKHSYGETYTNGHSNIVLSMPNVDPAYALAFQNEALEESYTDEIWLLRDIELTGEWFSVKREAIESAETGLYTIRWYLSRLLGQEFGFIYRDDYLSVMTEVNLIETNNAVKDDFLDRTRIDADGNWYHDTGLGTHYDRKNGIDVEPDTAYAGTVYTLNDTTVGRKIGVRSFYDEREKNWNVQFLVQQNSEDKRIFGRTAGNALLFQTNPNQGMLLDQGFNLSKDDIDTVETYYGAAVAAGVTRRIQVDPDEQTGLYNFTAIEITTSTVVAEFVTGNQKHYFGFHHAKKPTTLETEGGAGWALSADGWYENATHILVGGYNSDPGGTDLILSALDPTTEVSTSVRQEEDGTWSWNIQTTNPTEASYGDGDPENPADDGSDSLFRYGTPEDESRWIGRYLMEDIQAGTVINLVGEYRDIPANTYGVHGILTGRQLVIRQLRNERITDGKLSYDVYENILTADIEDDDGWFFLGTTETTDRQKKVMSSLVTDDDFTPAIETATSQTLLSDDTHIFTMIENATKQRKTVKRERKYFARRPRLTDLTSANLKDEMDAVNNTSGEPDVYTSQTFDVIRLGEHKFAVERVIVSSSSDIYPDEDAMTKYAPGGESACRRQQIALGDIPEVF